MTNSTPVSSHAPISIETWARLIRSGDRRSVAQAITAIENQESQATDLLKALYPHAGNAFVIGLTGAPGVGKSTLLEKLALAYRREGASVGIIALDPTSPFTGGAILGDRIRMQALSTNAGVFIRSMATRGQIGGLAAATADAVTVLDTAGFNVILTETVGVGQDEVEIARLADAVVLLLSPGFGDEIQAYKAGVMEIADVLVVNKSDLPGSERVAEQLGALLTAAQRPDSKRPALVKAVGTSGRGIPELHAILTEFQKQTTREISTLQKRVRTRARLTDLLRQKLLAKMVADTKESTNFDQGVEEILARRRDPYTVAQELLSDIGDALGWDRRPTPRVHHVAIAVSSLAEAVPIFETLLGRRGSPAEAIADQQVRIIYFHGQTCRIELLEPTSEESPIARFLSRRGPGIHHVALTVENLSETLEKLANEGFRLVDTEPRAGAGGRKIAFLHPQSTAGVLVELMEEPAEQNKLKG